MERRRRSRKKLITWMIAVFIAVPVLGLLVSSIVTYTMPKIYMSTAKVELIPSGVDVKAWGVDQYMATEIAVMRSDENLRLVSQKIQLDMRWGTYEKYVVQELSRIVTVSRVDGSRMIDITCRHRHKEDAQAVCQAVYSAYQERKASLYMDGAKGNITAIKNEAQIVRNKLEAELNDSKKLQTRVTELNSLILELNQEIIKNKNQIKLKPLFRFIKIKSI